MKEYGKTYEIDGESGDYSILKRSMAMLLIAKLDKPVFPETYSRLIPITEPTKKIKLPQDKSEILAQLIFHFGKDACIGGIYLDKITNGHVWEAEYRTGEDQYQIKPIVFTSGSMKAVVMPRSSDWSKDA